MVTKTFATTVRVVAIALLATVLVTSGSTSPVAADGNEAPANPFAFRSLSAGGQHTCAVTHNANVQCWGSNASGRLGLGDTASRGDAAGEMGDSLPSVDLGTGRTTTAVVAGTNHTCALLDNATVKCWGENGDGQLGLGDTADRGDNPGEMGNNLPAVDLGSGRTATAITAGGAHTCARLDNATVKCWGLNAGGQLGLGNTASRGDAAGEMGNSLPAVTLGTGRTATAVTAGSDHTCALLDDSTVKCWGSNGSGRLGLGDVLNRGDAAGEMGNSLPAVSLGSGRTATAVSAGAAHTCARLDNATVKCWGTNTSGRLGLGDTAARGDAAGEMGDALPTISLGTGRTAAAVSAGSAHTCAQLDNATVKCWGSSASGQLGHGDTRLRGDGANEMGDNLPRVNLGTGRTATAITTGTNHTCALLDNATIKCWGANGSGRLGLGDLDNRGDNAGEMGDSLPSVPASTARTATAISANTFHTCALLDNGTVKCWGDNAEGRLGLGDTQRRGDAPGEMGDALPAVALGTGRTATAITTGANHTCALLDNATVKCWGDNASGQLGLGDLSPRGDAPGEMGDALPAVALGTGRTATAISAGALHTCALLDNATVKCWGNNTAGRLGLGDLSPRGDAPGEMGDALPAVALGTGRTATAIVAGDSYTCARLDNATVKCWGNNASGRLGLGDALARGDAPGEMGDALPAVALGTGRTAAAVTAGDGHTCALLDNATVKCWGQGGGGRLGQGDDSIRGDAAGEMGDALLPVDLGSAEPAGASGTVTDTVTATPVAGAFVAALRSTDFSIAGGAVADGSGNYSLSLIPGSYFLYLIDPTGTHTAGFAGPPTTFVVPADTVIDADGTMAPARGAVSGTITKTGPNLPVPGGFALALNADTGAPERGAVADGTGAFTLPGLNPGNHFIGYLDPSGNRATRFFPNSVDVPSATPVNVTPGGNTVANGSLPTQTATGTGAALTGTVTEQGTATPLAGMFVLALRTSDFALARGGVTNGSGAYNLDVAAGTYKLAFIDPTGLHSGEWHNNQPLTNLAGAASVTAPTATNATLTRSTGSMSGHVDDQALGQPIAGAWVLAIGPTGISGGAITANDGSYTITGLPPGTYRAAFIDPTDEHTLEYFENSPDFAGATPFEVFADGDIVVSASLTAT